MDSFVGEIKIVGLDWAPRDWGKCDGTLLAIAQNQALFSLYGTKFAIPDFHGRTPIHAHNAGVPQGTSLDEQVIGTSPRFQRRKRAPCVTAIMIPLKLSTGNHATTLAANNDVTTTHINDIFQVLVDY